MEEREFFLPEHEEEKREAKELELGPLDFAVCSKKSGHHGNRVFVLRVEKEDDLKVIMTCTTSLSRSLPDSLSLSR